MYFSLLLFFQDIICQKNTVSRQSIFYSLCFSHIIHPLLTHRTYYEVQRICFFLQHAGSTVSNALCFSSQCSKGFLSRTPLWLRSRDECLDQCKISSLPLSRCVCTDDSCLMKYSRCMCCLKRHKHF